jgi:hypothetical protein
LTSRVPLIELSGIFVQQWKNTPSYKDHINHILVNKSHLNTFKRKETAGFWWLMPAILTAWETEIGRIVVPK